MRVYHRLIHIRDQRERHEDILPEIVNNPIFQLTTRFRLTVQAKSAPISKNSTLVVDQEALEIFGQLAAVLREENNIVMIYLVACIMERLFGKDTIEDIESIRGDLTIPEIIDGVSRPVDEPTPPEHHQAFVSNTTQPVSRSATEWLSSNFGSIPLPPTQPTTETATMKEEVQSAFAPLNSWKPPVQSAFSNLGSTSSAFGSTTSVFGGPTFGATPKSVFGGPVFGSTSQSSAPTSQQTPPPSATMPQKQGSILFPPPFPSNRSPLPQSTSPSEPLSLPKSTLSGQSSSETTPPIKPLFTPAPANAFHSYKPAVPSPLNPNAAAFTPTCTPAKYSDPSATSNSIPPIPLAGESIAPHVLSESPEATAVLLPPVTPVKERAREPTDPAPSTRMLDRSQTLWDFPGRPEFHNNFGATPGPSSDTPSTPITLVPVSPNSMPQMSKPQPLTLPPTPTARWFEPSSLPRPQQDSSLALRKQSLGLVLQMPDGPATAEILSPLALPSPRALKTLKSASIDMLSPSPSLTLDAAPSSSKLDGLNSSPTTHKSHKAKGKEKETPIDYNTMVDGFLRKSLVVRKYFDIWVKRTTDRAEYAEALQRSDAYKEKVRQDRLSRNLGHVNNTHRTPEAKKRSMSVLAPQKLGYAKRSRKRISTEYRAPISDEDLARRLKEVRSFDSFHDGNKILTLVVFNP